MPCRPEKKGVGFRFEAEEVGGAGEGAVFVAFRGADEEEVRREGDAVTEPVAGSAAGGGEALEFGDLGCGHDRDC